MQLAGMGPVCFDELCEAVSEAGGLGMITVAATSSGASPIRSWCTCALSDAIVSWQVGSTAEAVAAHRAGCDFIIAQGIEAGGHIRGSLGVLPLLSQVLDKVTIPVLAAGGIGSGRALAAVLAAGAAGARCGTRFVAATESGAHPVYVDALIAAQAEDSVRTNLYHVGCPLCPSTHGVLRSAIEAAQELRDEIVCSANPGVTEAVLL